MEQLATALAVHEVATLRFQFPFIENGLKRPDPAPVAQRVVRTAVGEAARRLHSVPLFAGGKSFGGRMTSQAQADAPLPDVRGLVFFGFPLHPAGKPSAQRADHLDRVRCPMLFHQGTRDALADLALIRAVTTKLGDRATLRIVDDADHAFHVRVKSGSNDAQVIEDLARTTVDWMKQVLRG
jgi:predicted alpha/beta-hydrolase family hydrolase